MWNQIDLKTLFQDLFDRQDTFDKKMFILTFYAYLFVEPILLKKV